MVVVALAAVGLLLYQSNLNPANQADSPKVENTQEVLEQKTVTPSGLNNTQLSSGIYQDEAISFNYPTTWETQPKQCDQNTCSLSFSVEKESVLIVLFTPNSSPLTQQPYDSVTEYLQDMYPDKTILSSTQSQDGKVTIYSLDETNPTLLFQLPVSKDIVTFIFETADGSEESVINSLRILE